MTAWVCHEDCIRGNILQGKGFQIFSSKIFSSKDFSSQRISKVSKENKLQQSWICGLESGVDESPLCWYHIHPTPPPYSTPFPVTPQLEKSFSSVNRSWTNERIIIPQWMSGLVIFFLCLSFCGSRYFYNASYSSWIWDDPSDSNQGGFWQGQDFYRAPGWLNFAPEITVQAVDDSKGSMENLCLGSH